jgi:hypothetical protein
MTRVDIRQLKIPVAWRNISLANVPHQLPRNVGATGAGEERAQAAGVPTCRG